MLSSLVERDLCEFDPQSGKYSLGLCSFALQIFVGGKPMSMTLQFQ